MKKENVIKKISNVVLMSFSVGITICLFAGGMALIGFIIALCIGGDVATQICVFIHKTYLPIIIQIASIFTGLGLLGMYLKKTKALTVEPSQKEDCATDKAIQNHDESSSLTEDLAQKTVESLDAQAKD